MDKKNIAGIVLAAGKGKRMNLQGVNKVTLLVSEKPMVVECVDLLKKIGLNPIVVVVGFAKESVKELFLKDIIFAEQTEQLGTADAVRSGIEMVPKDSKHVLIINGDSVYEEAAISGLISSYLQSDCPFMFLTTKLDNPTGIGRVVRNIDGEVSAIVEEKDATELIRTIHEVNAGCYIGSTDFFKRFLPLIKKSAVTDEYYLTNIVNIAINENQKIKTVFWENGVWVGINTPEEFLNAQKLS